MRTFKFALLIAVVSFGLSGTAFAGIPQPDSTEFPAEIKGPVGKKQWQAGRVIKLVRFSDADPNDTSIASGDAVVYDTNSADGITVRLTTTSGDAAFAGIAITTIETSDAVTGTSAMDDVGRRNWGYIVVHGVALANVDGAGGLAAGNPIMASADAGEVMVPVAGSYDTASRRQRVVGFAFGAGASNKARVFINNE